MTLEAIVAMSLNRCIGSDGKLPWDYPEDMAHFRKKTRRRVVIMGRKTYESIGKPLPGRSDLVLIRNTELQFKGVTCVNSFDAAVEAVPDVEEVMIIGGSAIYEMLLPQIDRMYLTYVDAEFQGDAWFPDYDVSQWAETDSVTHQVDEKNRFACRFVTLEKN